MYEVSLPHFEGPLDLLLFFVQRDELDIHDIPIARVADDFLAYTRAMQTVDLDGAGEFIFFAALLISIKARTLLPVQDTDDAGDPVDPRRELVERLLEYVRFKEAAAGLAALEAARALHATRTPEPAEPLPASDAVVGGTVLDLVRALRRILTQPVAAAQHAVRRVRVTVEETLEALWQAFAGGARVTFAGFTRARSRAFVIAALLGVLESVRGGTLRLRVAAGDDFFVEPAPSPAPGPELPVPEPA